MFAMSRAIRNLESGIRFSLTHFIPIFTEFTLLSCLIWGYCGPVYVANLVGMLTLYCLYTKIVADVFSKIEKVKYDKR